MKRRGNLSLAGLPTGLKMKKQDYTEIICKGFCKYYKPYKEELTCGSYEFLQNNLSVGELRKLVEKRLSIFKPDRDLICERCSFRIDGCDFYKGIAKTPCGGYTILFGRD